MGDMADFYADGIDWERPQRNSPQPKECTHCGEDNLFWRLTKQGWRLYNGDEIHNCPMFKKIQITEGK